MDITKTKADFSVSKAKNLIQKILQTTGGLVTLSKEKDDSFEYELEKTEKETQLIQKRGSATKEFEEIFENLSSKEKEEVIDYLFLEDTKILQKGAALAELTGKAVSNF